jgi:hypothetical protein
LEKNALELLFKDPPPAALTCEGERGGRNEKEERGHRGNIRKEIIIEKLRDITGIQ